MAGWDLAQLLDLHNLLVKCGYYCNHRTSEILFFFFLFFVSYERGNVKRESLGSLTKICADGIWICSLCFNISSVVTETLILN